MEAMVTMCPLCPDWRCGCSDLLNDVYRIIKAKVKRPKRKDPARKVRVCANAGGRKSVFSQAPYPLDVSTVFWERHEIHGVRITFPKTGNRPPTLTKSMLLIIETCFFDLFFSQKRGAKTNWCEFPMVSSWKLLNIFGNWSPGDLWF